MGADDVDPKAWVQLIGIPMQQTVEGLKRAIWWASGMAFGGGLVSGLIGPYVLKKLGLG